MGSVLGTVKPKDVKLKVTQETEEKGESMVLSNPNQSSIDTASPRSDTSSSSSTGSLRALGTRRPSMKVLLSDEEMMSAALLFTVDNEKDNVHQQISLELLPHEHSLFCERKERVCQSMGKLQEHESIRILTKPADNGVENIIPSKVCWMRSTVNPNTALVGAEGCIEYTRIIGTNKKTYQLTVDDVGCFMKARVTLEGADKKEYETNIVLGPVLPGPPRLMTITVEAINGLLLPKIDYVGGKEGASEFWWMRILNGERETLSDPIALTEQQQKSSIADLLKNPKSPETFGDPRVYILKESDKGCVFKLKCRPVRSDGYRGEVFTSKPSAKIGA